MNVATNIALIKAYLTLAELHRKAAMESGVYSYNRAMHSQKAQLAETQGLAWARQAESVAAIAAPEVCHG